MTSAGRVDDMSSRVFPGLAPHGLLRRDAHKFDLVKLADAVAAHSIASLPAQ